MSFVMSQHCTCSHQGGSSALVGCQHMHLDQGACQVVGVRPQQGIKDDLDSTENVMRVWQVA